uniref:BTB domain-containing protein n=1 Tax=Panagrolaimus davidi TaxID=227884 RepID=A0A914QV17_9BILA
MLHVNQFRQNKQNKRQMKAAGKNAAASSKAFEAPDIRNDNSATELSLQRYSIFSLQNVESGHFDVTFLFNEKELYAHSFVLWTASEIFETMLFGVWAKNEPIPITSHSYDDFKEFLTFLYLGQCNINMENIMALVDLSESYNVQILKEKCDQFLTDAKPTVENVFNICESLKTYSLQNALTNLYEFVAINALTILSSQSFLETKKDIVIDIVKMERLIINEEDLFKSVYKWAEYQSQKQKKENPSRLIKSLIKEELSDILPHIRFPIMNIEFLHSDVGM